MAKKKQIEQLYEMNLLPHVQIFVQEVLFEYLDIKDVRNVVTAFGLKNTKLVANKFFYLKEFTDGSIAGHPADEKEIQELVNEKMNTGPESFGLIIFDLAKCKRVTPNFKAIL
jgi:hypothetical protein